MSTPVGAQSTWRQLVDLIGRGRVTASAAGMARLRNLRADVPPPVRAASARALAYSTPPAALVGLFAEDELAIAAPVLRAAQLSAPEWIAILPSLSPAARSILRHRRDLPREVVRGLESFGSVDFVLAAPIAAFAAFETAPDPDAATATESATAPLVETLAEPAAAIEPPVADTVQTIDWTEVTGDAVAEPVAAEPPEAVIPETIAPVSPFVSIAAIAANMPLVAEALRHAERSAVAADAQPPIALVAPAGDAQPTGTFQIAELVARIEAYQRQREDMPVGAPRLEIQPELFAREPQQAETFRFETDASGVVRWIEGAARAPLIGMSLDLAALPHGSRVDGVAAGAFRRRSGFSDARLVVDGHSNAAGQWRIAGVPVFDRATGRFTGYRGTARRPRADECAEPVRAAHNPEADALRQLVHELRTPTNAIAGFAEMIESQMLGPVPAPYRAHASAIRSQTSGLLTAIDDIDMAARIETKALDLRPSDVPVAPVIGRIVADLQPLSLLRGTTLDCYVEDEDLAILGDDRAVERLIARLLATLIASGGAGERIGVAATRDDGLVAIAFDRPKALAAYAEEGLLTIDAESESERADQGGGAPLLGTGFALRLARNLAAELRGSLTIDDKTLTLRLPAAFSGAMEQVSSS